QRVAGADRAWLHRRPGAADGRDAGRGGGDPRRLSRGGHHRDQAPPGAPARRHRPARLRPHRPPPDDLAHSGRGMSTVPRPRDWADVLAGHAPREATAQRLVSQLRACEAAALAFCRLLERWARGDADPSTPGKRQAALRRAADRAETALAGLERPLGRYLLELEPEMAEGRSWYGEPGAGELREGEDVLRRAGVRVSRARVAQAYLELAVLVRALEGLADAAQVGSSPDTGSLWAGLFDLRENLLSQAVEDLRALAA